jgi:hypothetical protein
MQYLPKSQMALSFFIATVWMAWASSLAAQEERSFRNVSAGPLAYTVSASSGSVIFDPSSDTSREIKQEFDLTLWNHGADVFRFPTGFARGWEIKVYAPNSNRTGPICSQSESEDLPEVLNPGTHRAVTLACTFDPSDNFGSYEAEATFLPTGHVIRVRFTIDRPTDANILFTGKLMGYFRFPNHQSVQLGPEANGPYCTDPTKAVRPTDGTEIQEGEALSPDAQVFIDTYGDGHRGVSNDKVLVGTGDNFAPNYYSRIFFPTLPHFENRPGKELYEWDLTARAWKPYDQNTLSPTSNLLFQQGKGVIPTDNVACFLAYAHYDAIVPGKHDFYYGPERLRELARLLASIPRNNYFQPAQMLAANLMIKTTWAKDRAPISDGNKPPLNFLTKYLPTPPAKANLQPIYHNLQINDFTDGGFAFPWMRFVRLAATGWGEDDLRERLMVYLCKAERDNPDAFRTGRDEICQYGTRLILDSDATVEANADATASQPDEGGQSDDPSAPQRPIQLVYQIPDRALDPGQNYAICVGNPDVTVEGRTDIPPTNALPYCFRFSVYRPFFQFVDKGPTGDDSLPSGYQNPQLYVLKETPGYTPVVIFGVVDPLLLEHIGGDNYAWKNVRNLAGNRDKKYNTEIAFADPATSLVHLEDYFEKEYSASHGGKEFHGLRLLLAQMPPDEARVLSEHLPKCVRFDVVISAADDGLATPNEFLRVHPAEWMGNQESACHANVGAAGLKQTGKNFLNGALVIPPAFIAVPPTHEQSTHDPLARSIQVRSLRVRAESNRFHTYDLKGDPVPVRLRDTSSQSASNAENAFWLAVCQALYASDSTKSCTVRPKKAGLTIMVVFMTASMQNPARSSVIQWDDGVKAAALQQLALWSIREHHYADVAILQQRDFYPQGLHDYLAEDYNPEITKKLDIQQILDRIIWKGDFIRVISVQGAILKNILKQSDQFSKVDKTAYLPVSEPGRSLVTLGMKKDPQNSDSYLINGKPLDPNALYTIATSDYMALGDTGYTDLAAPPVGDPRTPASSVEMLVRISGQTCQNLLVYLAKNSDYFEQGDQACGKPLPRAGYYDELANQKPSDPRSGNTTWHQFATWSPFHSRFGQPTVKSAGAPPGPDDIANETQKRVEVQKNWDLSVTQLSVGFSGLSHNYSESTLSNFFAGVQNSQVNAKHAHSWDWDADSKFTLYHPNWDAFAEEGLQYSSSFTAQLQPPRSQSQSRNLFALDWGTYLHLLRSRGKGLPQLSLVFSGHLETPVSDPIVNVTLKPIPPSTASTTLTFDQDRTNLLLGRTALRWQNRNSYIEGGLEGGQTLNAIRQYNILTAPGGPVVICPLTASESLTKCVNTFNIPGSNLPSPPIPITPSSTVTATRSPQDRYGAYWSMGLTVPIDPKVSFTFQDTSDYFFLSSGDNSADTRFRHQLVNTLKFSVFPNLSFAPTYSVFLYENKLDYHFLFQQQLSIKINYSFDWSNWHERAQEFRYKKPSPE